MKGCSWSCGPLRSCLCCSVTAIFPAVIFHTTIGLRSWQGSERKEILMSVQNTTYTLLHVFITFQVTPCPMRAIQGALNNFQNNLSLLSILTAFKILLHPRWLLSFSVNVAIELKWEERKSHSFLTHGQLTYCLVRWNDNCDSAD